MCPLVAELKLKISQIEQFFIFSISDLSPAGAFQMLTHFYHLLPLGQKSVIQISERLKGLAVKKSSKTYQGGLTFSGFSTMYSRYP